MRNRPIVKICQSVVKILRFFYFSIWRLPPSWIFEFAKFYWLLGCRGSRRIGMLNFIEIGQSDAKILRFFDFSTWQPVRHLGLVWGIFEPPTMSTRGSLSVCKIWL